MRNKVLWVLYIQSLILVEHFNWKPITHYVHTPIHVPLYITRRKKSVPKNMGMRPNFLFRFFGVCVWLKMDENRMNGKKWGAKQWILFKIKWMHELLQSMWKIVSNLVCTTAFHTEIIECCSLWWELSMWLNDNFKKTLPRTLDFYDFFLDFL